jgi:hypothetical protein
MRGPNCPVNKNNRIRREVSNSAELRMRLELALADQRYTNLGCAAGR